jgi:hypothetical protein
VDENADAQKRIKEKRVYLEDLKRENIKRKEDKHARKIMLMQNIKEVESKNLALEFSCEKLQNQMEQLEREIGDLKVKITQKNNVEKKVTDDEEESEGTVSFNESDSSIDLHKSFEEIVFKDPNDFPILKSIIESQKLNRKPFPKAAAVPLKNQQQRQQRKKVTFAEQTKGKRFLRSTSNTNPPKIVTKSSTAKQPKTLATQHPKYPNAKQTKISTGKQPKASTTQRPSTPIAQPPKTPTIQKPKIPIFKQTSSTCASSPFAEATMNLSVEPPKTPISKLAAPTPIAISHAENDPEEMEQAENNPANIDQADDMSIEEHLEPQMEDEVEANKSTTPKARNSNFS